MSSKINIRKKDKFLCQEVYLQLLEDFIKDSYSGRRRKKDGARIKDVTINNYKFLKNYIIKFTNNSSFELKIYIYSNLTQNERNRAKLYNRKFYHSFTSYLYRNKIFDNYVGTLIKLLRSFYSYLENDRNISVGNYHKSFYIPKEEIQIVALTHEQLNYFISDKKFNKIAHLNGLEMVKDLFIFGCTIALRVSDLFKLANNNLLIRGDFYYIQVKSTKTNTFTSIKLPDYAVEIVNKYRGQQKTLFPYISIAWFNKQLKKLASFMIDDTELIKTRVRNGKTIIIYKDPVKKVHYKLSDHITSHTMRRTAITTMLNLGMPEHMVRKISGHAPNSKEFFRYVQLKQALLDQETDKIFKRITSSNKLTEN